MVEPLERVAPALEDRRALERLDAAGDDPERLAAGVVVDRPDRGQPLAAQAPVKLEGRFSRNAATPSAKSAVPTAACCSSASSASCSSSEAVVGVVEQLLGHPDGARRHRGPRGGDLGHPRLEVVGRDHLGDEPPGERLVGVELAVRAHPLERAREPEQPVEEPRATGVGHQADADEPGDEGCRARRDADVAGAREREPRSRDRPVDGRDHRLVERRGSA